MIYWFLLPSLISRGRGLCVRMEALVVVVAVAGAAVPCHPHWEWCSKCQFSLSALSTLLASSFPIAGVLIWALAWLADYMLVWMLGPLLAASCHYILIERCQSDNAVTRNCQFRFPLDACHHVWRQCHHVIGVLPPLRPVPVSPC